MIGCLGDVVFEVSDNVIKTIDNFQWSGSGRYSTHQRHGRVGMVEFTGLNPDKISFDMTLATYLGAKPMDEITKIVTYVRTGKTVPFTLGQKSYGRYRWLVQNYSFKAKTTD
ncbi:MAG: phage tail protein, partial [Oscillospiraceae bacterium]|nr:phage tail protein [Oscillospiraceae bacterium]